MTKFTPGPWIIGNEIGNEKDGHLWAIDAPKGNTHLNKVDIPWEMLAVVSGSEHFQADDATGKANAKLIASAPDLYKTLQNIKATAEILTGPDATRAIIRMAGEALKKAELSN